MIAFLPSFGWPMLDFWLAFGWLVTAFCQLVGGLWPACDLLLASLDRVFVNVSLDVASAFAIFFQNFNRLLAGVWLTCG